MASRASLITLIETNLESGTSITASEHREVEQAIVNSLAPYNRGTILVGNTPIIPGTFTTSGDISSAVCSSTTTGILCTMDNEMPNTNYLVRLHVQSLGTLSSDAQIMCPVFSTESTTQFRFHIYEIGTVIYTQNIKINVEVISLD
jgi:hypothetical protein